MKPVYIISSSCISPQASFHNENLDLPLHHTNENVFYCIEPDYSKFINPVQIRRMSRALKMGFTAAIDCLQKAGDPRPQGIIIGTGKGCMTDTEQFLHSMREFNETALNPTNFIHSTYNQINGMVALNKKINSYNVTYVHRGFSFEHSLIDAMMLIDDGDAEMVLTGSFDEMTSEHFDVKQIWGFWKEEKIDSNQLMISQTGGTIAGEGTSFYLLSNQKPSSIAVALQDIRTLYKPSNDDIKNTLNLILKDNEITHDDIDIIMLGESGDYHRQAPYQLIREALPMSQPLVFKHLCGEYDTSTNFAFWLSTEILQHQSIPRYLISPLDQLIKPSSSSIKTILIYNNYFEQNQSMILLRLAD